MAILEATGEVSKNGQALQQERTSIELGDVFKFSSPKYTEVNATMAATDY